jgi:NADH-quinone oxidoreductase subunit C/D
MTLNPFDAFVQRFEPEVTSQNEYELYATLAPGSMIAAIELLKAEGFTYLLDITAVDYESHPEAHPSQFALVYALRHGDFRHHVVLKCYIQETSMPTATTVFKAADWLERETFDQYGIIFKGHPNLKRLLNHQEFIGHPLRKSYPITKGQRCTTTDPLMDEMQAKLHQKGIIDKDANGNYSEPTKELMYLNLGPSHPASHGTIRTLAALDGETIEAGVTEIGYLHRGFEKSCENHTYNQIIPYTDRLNYCSAVANNIAFAKTIEEMLGVTLPERGIAIRVLLLELSRVMDHLVCLAANLVDMGALTNYWYLYNPREDIYDFLSKLTGARLTNSYMRVGGMAHDLYRGYERDLDDIIRKVEKGLDDTLSLIAHNRIFHDRTQNVGVITAEQAMEYALSGPNLRASGVNYDMRTARPYYFYDQFDFDVVLGSVGDVYDRMMVRFEEIRQSIRIIREVVKGMPGGAINVADARIILPPKPQVYTTIEGVMNQFKLVFEGVKVPAREYYGSLEAVNGELGFYVVSDGSGTPYKVKVRAPSLLSMAAYPEVIEGYQIADAVITLASINIIAGEMDR